MICPRGVGMYPMLALFRKNKYPAFVGLRDRGFALCTNPEPNATRNVVRVHERLSKIAKWEKSRRASRHSGRVGLRLSTVCISDRSPCPAPRAPRRAVLAQTALSFDAPQKPDISSSSSTRASVGPSSRSRERRVRRRSKYSNKKGRPYI